MTRASQSLVRTALLALSAALALSILAGVQAAERGAPSSKGLVDGSAFRDLAGDDDEIVEVNLGGSMLQAIAGGKNADSDLGSVLTGLRSIQAYIVGLGTQADKIDRALKLAADLASKLRRQGWESLVTVREKQSKVNVMTLSEDDTVQGLVVIAVDPAEGRAVFVNIAGAINLARLGELASVIDVPGLDAVGTVPATPQPSKEKKKEVE